MFFVRALFQKKHPIGFRGTVIIEKQYLIIRIARDSHLQVLKNFLKGGEFYEIHVFGI